jgi:hypothetical protein
MGVAKRLAVRDRWLISLRVMSADVPKPGSKKMQTQPQTQAQQELPLQVTPQMRAAVESGLCPGAWYDAVAAADADPELVESRRLFDGDEPNAEEAATAEAVTEAVEAPHPLDDDLVEIRLIGRRGAAERLLREARAHVDWKDGCIDEIGDAGADPTLAEGAAVDGVEPLKNAPPIAD